MAIELDWESERLLCMRYTGMVHGRELLSTTLEISGDQRFDDLRYILSDWSNIKKTDISVDDVRVLAAYIKSMSKINGKIKNATVVSKDEAGQALASFYKHLTRDAAWDVDSFNTSEAARSWFAERGSSVNHSTI